jgi:hypothetical protein
LNRWIITSSLAGALALPLLIAPATASASCNDRKVAGTVVGGVGGALIGNSIARGGGGAILGGLGGAMLGHEVARSTCRHESYHEQRSEYHGAYRPSERGHEAYPPGAAYQGDAQPPPQRTVYYDDRGNVIDPVAAPGPPAYATVAYQSACRTETQSYYNDRGELVQYPVQTCAR